MGTINVSAEKLNKSDKILIRVLLSLIIIMFYALSIFNIFQPHRKTISELENRNLETFPEFTFDAFMSGSFFEKIDLFVSDTFIYRDELMSLSQKINSYKSISNFIKESDDHFVFIPSKAGEMVDIKKGFEEETSENNVESIEETLFDNIDNLISETTKAIEYKDEEGAAEKITGYILYKDIPYHSGWVDFKGVGMYADTLKLYSETFPNARISSVVAPMSSLILDNKTIQKSLLNQQEAIDTINSMLPENVNALNICYSLYNHKDENVYFKYDHHWTHRGAYYAYEAFCKSIGLKPTPIDNMEMVLINKGWQGTTYASTGDERLKSGREKLEVYMPTKQNLMVLIDNKTGEAKTYDSCIVRDSVSYTALIGGDNPYTVISIPENPQDKNILVIKDSYGNGFCTYLCENYGNIIIIDPRHVNYNILPIVKDFNITDVVFMVALYNTCNKTFLGKAKDIVTMSSP